MHKNTSSASVALTFFVILVLGAAALVGPFFLEQVTGPAKTIMVIGGGAFLFVGLLGLVITKLYVKTSPDLAFIRTGMGGPRTVVDGGTVVVPGFHEVKAIPLTTFRIAVDRRDAEALITSDSLRAEVQAVFFVRVQKKEEDIAQAAASLPHFAAEGSRAVENLVGDKLVSALRTVAAKHTLSQLNSDRATFASAVQEIVSEELKPNGLSLETVTISHLDQAPLSAMRPDENYFDAVGAKTIAEQVQKNRVERRRVELEADQQVREQEVATSQRIAEQDVIEANALAEAGAKKRTTAAEADQRARTAEAEQHRLAEEARVASERSVAVAELEKQKTTEVADQERQKALEVARIEAAKASELAAQEQKISVAEAEKRRADAEAAQLVAEKEREAAAQAVTTTQRLAEAERASKQSIIAKQGDAETRRIEEQNKADVEAYRKVKLAEGAATAAEKEAEAQLKLAEAEKQAAVLRAEGRRADELVPVNVAAEQVKVDQARVEVLKQELEAKAANESVAVQLQVAEFMITAMKEIGVEQAKAMGTAMSSAKIQVWGDPEAVKKLTDSFANGQAAATLMDGFFTKMPQVKALVEGAIGKLTTAVTANPSEVSEDDEAKALAESTVKD